MNEPKTPRLFPLGLIAALSITLASFEWTAMEWSEPAGWSYQATSLLESEMAPVSVPIQTCSTAEAFHQPARGLSTH